MHCTRAQISCLHHLCSGCLSVTSDMFMSVMIHAALQILNEQQLDRHRCMTVGEYLHKHKYSTAFIDSYFLPMCAAVWSAPNSQVQSSHRQVIVKSWACSKFMQTDWVGAALHAACLAIQQMLGRCAASNAAASDWRRRVHIKERRPLQKLLPEARTRSSSTILQSR